MLPPLLRRSLHGGAAYSAIQLHGVTHVFATALPRDGQTIREQMRSAIHVLQEALQPLEAADSLLHLTVFVADGVNRVAACRQVVRSCFAEKIPATSYVAQSPCAGTFVALEAIALGHGREKVQISRVSDQVLLARQEGTTWIYADQAVPLTSAHGVYEKTICSYQHLRRLLPQARARLDQVLRIWLYLGGIVDAEGPTQRYKELNRARAEVYEKVPFLTESLPDDWTGSVFPASTGIGTSGRSINLSAVALLSDESDVATVPLENPRQTAAFAYSTRYSPQTPKFSRGMAVVHGTDTTFFISGTASITQSETRHPVDVVAQTHETLENIGALISEENLSRHGLPGRGTTLQGLAVARVYVKHAKDYLAVRRVCEQRLAGVPVNYVVADVCRTDLLVEIEGIAFSQDAAGDERAAAGCVRRHRPLPTAETARELAKAGHICPSGCPERKVCPYAVCH